MALRNWFRSLRTKTPQHNTPRPRTQLCVEQLEAREVPAANFQSAFGFQAAYINDVATDAAGNSYVTGVIRGTVDFDPANTHAGDTDILTLPVGQIADAYVAKYAPDNSLIWATQMGGIGNTTMRAGTHIAVDATGNVYVGGHFNETVAFGSVTLTSAGAGDGFAVKLDPVGNVLWANRSGGSLHENFQGIEIDNAGNVFTVAWTKSGSGTGINADVQKYASDGTSVWSRRIGQTNQHINPVGLATDAAGNVYVTGTFKGTVDFAPATNTSGDTVVGNTVNSGYVVKIKANGSFGWVSPFLGVTVGSTTGTSSCHDVTVDNTGSVIVGGSYSGPVDFKPGNGSQQLPYVSGTYGFVTKLTSSGSLTWAKQVGHVVNAVAVDASGGIYAAGTFSNTWNFGTRTLTATAPSPDTFIVKMNSSNGNNTWAGAFNGPVFQSVSGLAVAPDGTITITGSAGGGATDYDPDPLATYYLTTDSVLVKLSQN